MEKTRSLILNESRRKFIKNTAALSTALFIPPVIGRAQASMQINVMSQDAFIPKDVRDKFTAETGIAVNFRQGISDIGQVFNLLATEAENPETDLIVAGGHRMYSYIVADMLQPLDEARLPGLAAINPMYLDHPSQFIDGKRYGIPVMIGFYIMASRAPVVSQADTETWASVFEDTYAGRCTLRPGSALYAAMFYKGLQDTWFNYSGDIASIEAMFEECLAFVNERKHVLRKWYEQAAELQQLFVSNEVDIGQGMNEGVMRMVKADPTIQRGIPKEGAIGYSLNYAIPKAAPNEEAVYTFVNYLLSDPGIAGSMIRSSGNLSTFTNGTAGLDEADQKLYHFSDDELSRIGLLDTKGADDTRYEILDKYTAQIV